MTHKVQEIGRAIGEELQRGKLSRWHLPSESCCSWDPRFPMLNAKLGMDKKKGEGVSLQTPSLTTFCPLYRCPLRMTSLMLSPPSSSVSPFCSSLWPSWFLPAFHSFPHLPFSLPPFPLLESTHRQAKQFSYVIKSGFSLSEDSPPCTSDLIHAGKDVSTYYKGSGLCVFLGLFQCCFSMGNASEAAQNARWDIGECIKICTHNKQFNLFVRKSIPPLSRSLVHTCLQLKRFLLHNNQYL